jgi:cytochrome c biogenesis protein CcmG, thiol:disulfide interchange protein DsbE
VLSEGEMAQPVAPAKEEPASPFTIGVVVVTLVAGFALLPRLFGGSGSVLDGKEAPEVSIAYVANAPDGATKVSLSELRGHPVLLDFWATWCVPCQQEAPVVDRIAQRYGSQGLAVVGVNTSDEQGNAAPFAKRHHLTYPIAYDEGQRIAAAYGVENLPTLIVISKTGKVMAVRSGVTSDAELEDLVKRAL